jgi:hypothetical protein
VKIIDNAERPVIQHVLDPEKAYLAGRLTTDDIDSLQRFRQVFPVNPQTTLDVAQDVREDLEAKVNEGILQNEDVADVVFLKLLPALFERESAKGWTATLGFQITDAGDYTVAVSDGAVRVEKGSPDEPTAFVKMDMETMTGVLNFGALETSRLIERVEIDDSEYLNEELQDDQLEAISGGKKKRKGSSSACGAAGGYKTSCGKDACGAAGGVETACGAAACGAAGCGRDACGAAACGAALCSWAACGVAAGAGACAGNACAVDVNAIGDIGPCAVNVIPGIPGI